MVIELTPLTTMTIVQPLQCPDTFAMNRTTPPPGAAKPKRVLLAAKRMSRNRWNPKASIILSERNIRSNNDKSVVNTRSSCSNNSRKSSFRDSPCRKYQNKKHPHRPCHLHPHHHCPRHPPKNHLSHHRLPWHRHHLLHRKIQKWWLVSKNRQYQIWPYPQQQNQQQQQPQYPLVLLLVQEKPATSKATTKRTRNPRTRHLIHCRRHHHRRRRHHHHNQHLHNQHLHNRHLHNRPNPNHPPCLPKRSSIKANDDNTNTNNSNC